MKLLIAIVQDYDANQLLTALSEAGFRATRIASSGGFLRMGNTTLLIGVDDAVVHQVLRIIEEHCRQRTEVVPPEIVGDLHEWYPPNLIEVVVGGATVFTVPVERFERIE